MKALGITQPTAANPGGRVNAVRWRKLSALKQFHRSFVMQSALETYLPAGRGAYPQAGDAYDATVRLLPYFSCFEDAFRKQPAAFSKDHAAIRNAREGAAARCEPIRVTALRAAGVEPKAPPARLDPHARLRVAMSDFENGIVHYQQELNNASPPPQPPPAPPSPVPSRD